MQTSGALRVEYGYDHTRSIERMNRNIDVAIGSTHDLLRMLLTDVGEGVLEAYERALVRGQPADWSRLWHSSYQFVQICERFAVGGPAYAELAQFVRENDDLATAP